MQVMVVPNTSMEGLARRLAFQIGGTGVHTCSGYTSQHYSDSEPALFVGRTQSPAVVFPGKSELAESLGPILPERFHDHGVSCFPRGRRAGIDAKVLVKAFALELVNLRRSVACSALSAAITSPRLDMRRLPRLARGLAPPSRRRPNEKSKNQRFTAISAAVGAGVPLVQAVTGGLVPGVAELSFIGALRYDSAQIGNLRIQFCDELHADGVSQFVEEDFSKMVESS